MNQHSTPTPTNPGVNTLSPWWMLVTAATNELPPLTPAAPGESPEQARERIDRDMLALGAWRRANLARLNEGVTEDHGHGLTLQARALCRAAGIRFDYLDQSWARTWPTPEEQSLHPYPTSRVFCGHTCGHVTSVPPQP